MLVDPSAVDATLVSLTAMAMAVMTVMVFQPQLLLLQTKLAAEAAEVQVDHLLDHSVRRLEQSQHALLLKKQKSLSVVSQLLLSRFHAALLRHQLLRKSVSFQQKHQQ